MAASVPSPPPLPTLWSVPDPLWERIRPILAGLGSALRGGGVTESAHLTEWRDVHHMVVEHPEPFPYQVDGDYLGDVTRLEFDYVPNAVKLVFPGQA